MKSLIEQFKDNNFLITTDSWFIAPDGKSYKAVWGKVEIYSDEETLGIKTNDKSTNWYAIVGEAGQGRRVVVAGCQIRYACVCIEKPYTGDRTERWASEHQAKTYDGELKTNIYLAQ